jgi:rhodanese-related sulfurtransferase
VPLFQAAIAGLASDTNQKTKGRSVMRQLLLIGVLLGLASLPVDAQASGVAVKTSRVQALSATGHARESQTSSQQGITFLPDQSAQTCPAFCISPIAFGGDVRTVDELDLLKFMQTSERGAKGVIIDTRSPDWYQRGTIPGSVNIPYTVFEKPASDAELTRVFEKLGVRPRHNVSLVLRMFERLGLLGGKLKTAHWDFTHAKDIALLCNDAWCRQSPRAIKALLSQGYPAKKLYYYRGGLQTWEALGLTLQVPASTRLATR